MNIGMVTMSTYPSPPTGYGGEVFGWNLCCALLDLGHKVTLYAPAGSKLPVGVLTGKEGELVSFPCTYGGLDIFMEGWVVDHHWKRLLEHDFLIDNSHQKFLGQEINLWHKEIRGKVCNLLNGTVTHTPKPTFNMVVGSKKWAELVITGVSQFAGTPSEKSYGGVLSGKIPQEEVYIIYYGTDIHFYTPGIAPKEDYVVWLANPSPFKGLGNTLKACKIAKTHLKIIFPHGTNPDHAKLAAQYTEVIKNEKFDAEIVYIPLDAHYHETKREILRKAKCMMFLPDSHEPFGLCVVEAGACDVPVIVNRMGALPEIIKSGVNGYVVEADDNIAENAAVALCNIDRIKPEVCRKDVVERFSIERVARDYVGLAEILKERYAS